MSVKATLQQAGLGHLAPAFEGISIEKFKSLLIQDYEKHGVRDMADKQALFKVIKDLSLDDCSLTLSPEPSVASHANSSPEPGARYQAQLDFEDGDDIQLLDLEADDDDDDDFLAEQLDAEAFSQAFMRSATPERALLPPSAAASTTNAAPTTSASVAGVVGASGAAVSGRVPAANGSGLLRTESTAASTAGAAYSNTAAEEAASLAAIADPPRIRVIVRKRPLNKKEIERGEADVLECDPANATLYVHEPKVKVDLTKYTDCHTFRFDDVFDEFVDNDALYERAMRPLIATLFRAGRGTCFAYGQTGSGKTYTMQPLPLRAAADIFRVTQAVPEFASLSLHVACYEIYGGKVFDLLNARNKLEVREDHKRKVQVVGLKEVEVSDVDTLARLCDHAACARSTGSTGANDESSRSHSIMVFALRAPAPAASTGPGLGRPRAAAGRPGHDAAVAPGPPLRTVGKLSFIDLAGSERGADTYDNDKQTRLEGAEINKSLLALKECIRALDMEAGHIPFRGSKLTSVLRDSFVGKNARTVMIANVSPSSSSCEHTLNTLRYADRVKEIKKDGPRPPAGAATAAAAPPGRGGAENGVQEIAALLKKLPPPSLPDGQAPAPAVPPPAPSPARPLRQPLSPSKHPSNRAAGTAFDPGAPSPLPVKPAARESIIAAQAQAAVAAPPARAATSSPSPGRSASSTRTSTSGQQQQSGGPPRRGGSITAHPLVPSTSDVSQNSGLSEAAADASLDALLAAEEELIGAHRRHIETTMGVVKDEMELLARLDDSAGNGMTIEEYLEELSNILVDKAAAAAALQQQVTAFRRQMRAAAGQT